MPPPASGLRSPASGLRPPVSGLRSPASGLRPQVSGLRSPASGLTPQASGLTKGPSFPKDGKAKPPGSSNFPRSRMSRNRARTRPPAAGSPCVASAAGTRRPGAMRLRPGVCRRTYGPGHRGAWAFPDLPAPMLRQAGQSPTTFSASHPAALESRGSAVHGSARSAG